MPDCPNSGGVSARRVRAILRIVLSILVILHVWGQSMGPTLGPTGAVGALPEPRMVTDWVGTMLIGLTAAAIFVGVGVRPAAMILAVYIFAAATVTRGGLLGGPEDPARLWLELSMVGALVFVALTTLQETGTAPRSWMRRGIGQSPCGVADYKSTLARIEAQERRLRGVTVPGLRAA